MPILEWWYTPRVQRACPTCGASYQAHVAFCFADGTPLDDVDPAPTPPPVDRRAARPSPRGSVVPWLVVVAAGLAAWWLSR
jgi:hypothetical protein